MRASTLGHVVPHDFSHADGREEYSSVGLRPLSGALSTMENVNPIED
jgi:hypothetical protein